MENLTEMEIWVYFWTGSAFMFLMLWLLTELYYKLKKQ